MQGRPKYPYYSTLEFQFDLFDIDFFFTFPITMDITVLILRQLQLAHDKHELTDSY